MKIDKHEFFHQATRRITGSLDIGKAMLEFIRFAQPYIPVTEISIGRLRMEFPAVENLKTVSISGKIAVAPPCPLTPVLANFFHDRILEWEAGGRMVVIDNHPENHPLGDIGLVFFDTKDPAVMVMHLVLDGVTIGGVALFAENHGPFTEEHASLMASLREPFAIAMSNALQQRELQQLKKKYERGDYLDDPIELPPEILHRCEEVIIGADKGLAGVMEMVRQVAPLSSPVMLLGETGVGKEVIANEIHRLSPRRDGPFIKVNCGAIPESLIDAELFGHERGAFTGAVSQKPGRFERANGGTIFLDEIGDLPLPAQVRLLRVLQNKEIERVGGTRTIQVDVRIVSATNKGLQGMVREGTFREDLWYRLNIFPIAIPPLRQHPEDIPALVHYFISKKARELNIRSMPQLATLIVKKLVNYAWPGNVRELENLVERMLIRSRGKEKNLVDEFMHQFGATEVVADYGLEKRSFVAAPLDEVITRHIVGTLEQTGGKIEGPDGAAALLKVNANTLRSRMRKFGIKAEKRWN